jgi:hypothetical protein
MRPDTSFNFPEARQKFGERADKFARFLYQTDPLADALIAAFTELPAGKGYRMLQTALDQGIDAVADAPPALQRLFAQLDDVPFWVDWDQLDLGGAVFLRSGLLGVVVLMLRCLPLSYCSPSGNKPLVFSGRLTERAARRLGETGRFVIATCQPGALKRFSEGFKITVKVRLMHAQVRFLAVEGSPDDDARTLVRALMNTPLSPRMKQARWSTNAAYGISRALVGEEIADLLHYPNTAWRLAVPAMRPVVLAVTAARRYLPGGQTLAERVGMQLWQWTVNNHLSGSPAQFGLLERLGQR